MTIPARRPFHIILAAFTILLAVLLVFSALRTFQELNDQRTVFLRSRVAAVAARLEITTEDQWQQLLAEEDEALIGLKIFDRPSSPAFLNPLWEGRELFHTETLTTPVPAFRAYVPFHNGSSLRIARIDIAESAADFLTAHAGHHLWYVALGGLLIVTLTVFTVWNAGRLALSERRQLELQHLATLGEMSAALAHEIRNPLGTIKGYAQLLGEKLDGAHATLLSPILQETTRLEELVKDLLLYGRPSLPVFQSIRSTDIEHTVSQHALHLIDAPTLRFESAAAPLTLETDPQILEQVLLNLLRNAVDAVQSQPVGVVRFEITSVSDHALLRVLDNGPGLSEETSHRLFEPFYTTKAAGTGLGLSVSRKLVESLGGHLTIEPRPNGGISAEILLPLRHHA